MNLLDMYRAAQAARVEDPYNPGLSRPAPTAPGYSYPNSIQRPQAVQEQRAYTKGPLWEQYFGPKGSTPMLEPGQPGYNVEEQTINYGLYLKDMFEREATKADR